MLTRTLECFFLLPCQSGKLCWSASQTREVVTVLSLRQQRTRCLVGSELRSLVRQLLERLAVLCGRGRLRLKLLPFGQKCPCCLPVVRLDLSLLFGNRRRHWSFGFFLLNRVHVCSSARVDHVVFLVI